MKSLISGTPWVLNLLGLMSLILWSAPGTAGDPQEISLNDYLRADIQRIQSYEIGETTLNQFLDDGWDFSAPWLGRMGIMSIKSAAGAATVVLGIGDIDNARTARETALLFDMMIDRLRKGDSVAFDQSVKASRLDPVDVTVRTCRLQFKDNLLVSRQCADVGQDGVEETDPPKPDNAGWRIYRESDGDHTLLQVQRPNSEDRQTVLKSPVFVETYGIQEGGDYIAYTSGDSGEYNLIVQALNTGRRLHSESIKNQRGEIQFIGTQRVSYHSDQDDLSIDLTE